MKKLLLILLSIAVVFCFSACNDESTDMPDYGDPAEYAGVYYSGSVDGRALFLYVDGRYEWYNVPVGGSPEQAGAGLFKTRGGRILFGSSDDEYDFIINNQLSLSEGKISEGSIDFNKVSDELDKALLDEFTEIDVPLESYLGEWENDTVYGLKLTLTQDEYTLDSEDRILSGTFRPGKDFLLIGKDDNKVTRSEDGTLKIEGYDGVFYRAGSGKTPPSPYAVYIGDWHNTTANSSLMLHEGGTYGFDLDGSVSVGTFVIEGEGIKFSDYTAKLVDGKLIVSGIDGVFVKE